jgi:general secretion pathway protein M
MIKAYLQQLSPRERTMVILAGIAMITLLFYLALWAPLQKGIENKQRLVLLQQEQLKTMRAQAQDIRLAQNSSRSRQNITDSSSLLSVIDRTAKQEKIKSALQKAQPEGEDGVRLWLVDITFDRMIDWLNQLDLQYGIYVSDISIERDEKFGRVDSRILLRVNL